MLLKTMLTAAAASALMAGVAFAQPTSSAAAPDPAQPSGSTTGEVTAPRADPTLPSSSATAPDATQAPDASAPPTASTGQAVSTSATTTDPATGATMTTQTLTNGPVPDTAANRAKYGKPLSNAGRRTAPKGN
jgi:hypothetical protein